MSGIRSRFAMRPDHDQILFSATKASNKVSGRDKGDLGEIGRSRMPIERSRRLKAVP